MFFTASGFSIFAIIPMPLLFFFNILFKLIRSWASLTKDRASHSIFSFNINFRSFLSFVVRHGSDIFVLGKFIPLKELSVPGTTTFVLTIPALVVSKTFNFIFPSSIRTFSPFLTSFEKFL